MTWKLKVPARLPRANPAPRPDASFGEVIGAAFDNESIDADINNYGARVETEVLHTIADRLGPAALPSSVVEGLAYPKANPFKRSRADLLAAAAEAERKNPAAWGDLPTSDAAVTAEGARRRSAEAADNLDTLSMGGGGIGQMAAEFIGAGGTVFTDPVQAPLLLLGAGAGGLARTVAVEAVLGGAGELVTLPARARVAEELGRPDLTPGAMAAQVAGGAAFGAGFGALAHGVQRGAAYLAGRTEHARSTTPAGSEAGDHAAAIDEAEAALREGRAVPSPATVTTKADIARVTAKIINVESGGRAGAKNPTPGQTSSGLGGFTDCTWLTMIERHRPDLHRTKTKAELLAMKSDPRLGEEMTSAAVVDYKSRLEAEGLQPTDANMYLAHFLGEGGAVRALLEDPAAPIGKVMTTKQIDANKGMTFAGRPIQHWTVQDLRRWSEAKMGQGVDPGAAYTAATRRGYTSGDEVVTPAGTRVTVEYEVVDIDTLTLASGDRQPRDRSRAAPTAKVAERAAALDPAQLLPSPLAGSGAPVVGADGIIDSGNGRTMSIIHARENFPDRYAAYLEAMRAAGFEIADGQMLIARRTTDLDGDALRQFVREANDDVVERMSPSEQARADAAALTDEALGLYDPDAGGVGAAPNKGFLTKVVDGLPASQQGSVMDGQGRLTPAGATRIQSALLARAFDAPDLIEAATEGAGAEIKSLLDALTDVAPAWAQMRAAAKAGGVAADFDITPQLVEAVRLIRKARATSIRDGIPVHAALTDALAQGDMFAGGVDPITVRLVGIAYEGGRARSRDAVAGALREYVAEARKIGGDGGGLLDAVAPAGPLDILDGARARLDSAAPDAQAAGDAAPGREIGPAGVSVIDVDAVDDALWTDGAMSPAAQAGADEAEAILRAQIGGTPDAATETPVQAIDRLAAEQPFSTLDDLYALAAPAQAQLAEMADGIAARLGVSFKNPGLKGRAATEEKIGRKKYGSITSLTDIARGGFAIDTAGQADEIAAAFRDAGLTVVDEGWVLRQDAGFMDRKLMLRMGNGLLAEVQIWSRPMIDAKMSKGQELYTLARSEPDPAKRADLDRQQLELYTAALEASDPSFRAAAGSSNLPNVGSNIARNAASSDTRAAVAPTSSRSTSTQSPPGVSSAQDVSPTVTDGRRSQLPNFMEGSSAGDPSNIGTPAGEVNAPVAASPDPVHAAIVDAGDFEVEPGVMASEVLDDLAADAEFAEVVSLCGIGGRADG